MGSSTLGIPLTPAYRVEQGVVQFFMSGALFLPGNGSSASRSAPAEWEVTHFGDLAQPTFADGVRDPTSGIIRLPLLYSLLIDGSTLPIDGSTSSLTYAELRNAVQARTLIPFSSHDQELDRGLAMLLEAPSPSPVSAGEKGVFIPEGYRGKVPVGHIIPESIWSYINSSTVSLHGWRTDFGIPLSEARPFVITEDGTTLHLEVQVFEHAALVVTPAGGSASESPTVEQLNTGLAFLETLGPPAPAVEGDTSIWGLSDWVDTPILSAPATGQPQAYVGLNFPLSLDDAYDWIQGVLWYRVRWRDGQSSGTGWIAADETTIHKPAAGSPIWSSFAPLSSALAGYLAAQGSHVSAVVFDSTGNQYYLFNVPKEFYMASSVKVPIMLALLTQLEQQGREPNAEESSLLMTMIENSNNNSAQALFDEIGGAGALDNFMQSLHIGNFSAFQAAWGYSTVSPLSMVRLLTLLHDGKILTAPDRRLALYLMEHIESDETEGVGTATAKDATVAMKDGWVPAPDGLWVMNTSGIVTLGPETYVISVYSQEDSSLDEGWVIAEQVCALVSQQLLAS